MSRAQINLSAGFCVLILLFGVLLAHPVADAGIGDDFSYIWSARAMAATGHIAYSGWSTSILTWQIWLGALFIRVFGFSFTAVRASIVLLSLVSAALTHRIFVRLGFGLWNASVATLGMLLSPMALPLESTFFNDVPGYFAVLVCLYFCVRALQAGTDRASVTWLAAGSVAGVLLATTRQTSFLGPLLLVPAAAWCVRQRRGVPLAAALLWLLSLLVMLLTVRWFYHQPYALHEDPVFGHQLHLLQTVTHIGLTALLLCLPVLSGFLVVRPSVRRTRGFLRTAAGGVAGCAAVLLIPGGHLTKAIGYILWGTAYVPLTLRLCVASFAGACLLSMLDVVWRRPATQEELAAVAVESGIRLSGSRLAGRTLLLLLGPFTASYLILIATRITFWPRYMLPLLPVFFIGLLWAYTRGAPSRKLPLLSVAVVVAYSVLGVACTHDLFAAGRAAHAAETQYVRAGHPRYMLDGGNSSFALDGWAQLKMTGYLNDWRILRPAGLYRARPASGRPPECDGWFLKWTPNIQPRYQLSNGPSACYASVLPPVPYRTWIPPYQHAIYTSQITEAKSGSR